MSAPPPTPIPHDRPRLSLPATGALRPSLALAALLLLAALAHSVEVPLAVRVVDASGVVVPDVLIQVQYQSDGFRPLLDGQVEGFTNVRGQWRTAVQIANLSRALPLQVRAYAPYWASGTASAPIGPSEPSAAADFTLNLTLESYDVRVVDEAGAPVPGALVRLSSPWPLSRATDSAGLAQFRLPPGSNVSGRVEHLASYQPLSIPPSPSGAPVEVRLPFADPRPLLPSGPAYSASIQVRGVRDETLPFLLVNVSSGGQTRSYLTDNAGYIHLRSAERPDALLSWAVDGNVYSADLDLAARPTLARAPVSIRILPPVVLSIGESCQRVSVTVINPRVGIPLNVTARSSGGSGAPLAFAADPRTPLDGANVTFNRLFCPGNDTDFEITASNRYESRTVRVQLRSTPFEPAPAETEPGSEDGGPSSPPPVPPSGSNGTAAAEQRRQETLLLIMEGAVGVVALAAAFLFRARLVFVFQSVLRYLNGAVQSRGKPKPPARPPMAS